jgi:hypothetical protein
VPDKLHTTQPAAAVADWLTVLRAAEKLRFSKVTYWREWDLHYCEFAAASGRLCRDIVLDGGEVRTVEDCDV